ncbi:hypothetical protein ACKLKD_02740 [Klebsiella sp. 10982]|nr:MULTISPECIES: hypothetical protein [Klebsiella]MEA1149231.1 hypothetical protein [Klebsiella pneumoniae]MBF7819905.1 hypothetical protein [Klebsiella quasivariicola]MBS5211771.1 hypothetical protein [Klebsiella sp.]MBZ9578759.1 hypothetical protein [Klebsiella quasivariicola]MCJ1825973.1 hypothetical protein [Klebsiella quasivariicola]
MTPINVFYRGGDCTIFYALSRPFSRGIVAALKGLESERIMEIN